MRRLGRRRLSSPPRTAQSGSPVRGRSSSSRLRPQKVLNLGSSRTRAGISPRCAHALAYCLPLNAASVASAIASHTWITHGALTSACSQAWLKGDGAIIPLLQTHALFQGCTWGLNYEPTYRKALALVMEHKPTPTSPVVTDPDLLELRELAEGIAANQAKAVSIGIKHKEAAASKKQKKEESAGGAEMRERFTQARYSHSSLPSAAGFEQRRASLPSRRKYTLDEYAEHGDSFEEDFLTSGKVAPGWETTKVRFREREAG